MRESGIWLFALGSLIWLPVMVIYWLAQGDTDTAFLGLIILGIAILYLRAFGKEPGGLRGRRLIGYFGILAAGLALAIWKFFEDLHAEAFPLFFVWTLFLPPLIFVKNGPSQRA